MNIFRYLHRTPALSPPRLPPDLDRRLMESEAKYPHIRPETRKKIVWRSPEKRRTRLSIVFFHGFSASRMELHPLCDLLADRFDANLFYARLKGHGLDGNALADATVEDWLADGMEALAIGGRLGEKVILMGNSMGAILATWLAAQPASRPTPHSLVLLSPGYSINHPLAFLAQWSLGRRYLEKKLGAERRHPPLNSRQERYWTLQYPTRALFSMFALSRMARVAKLGRLTMPVLMMFNENDQLVRPDAIRKRFRDIPSPHKKMVVFNENKDPLSHVLAGDALSPETTPKVFSIIESFVAGATSPGDATVSSR
ncbi:MAG: alpha/beta hydrolase [Desulfobacterales bacterium]|nr:alpha/beta hydrolase [Desulfobacterales bacterium]